MNPYKDAAKILEAMDAYPQVLRGAWLDDAKPGTYCPLGCLAGGPPAMSVKAPAKLGWDDDTVFNFVSAWDHESAKSTESTHGARVARLVEAAWTGPVLESSL